MNITAILGTLNSKQIKNYFNYKYDVITDLYYKEYQGSEYIIIKYFNAM